MFEQAFKNIDDVLWKDAGCTSELDYTEQTSWLLFLKYLDALDRKKYTHIVERLQSATTEDSSVVGREGELKRQSSMQIMHIPNSDKPVDFTAADCDIGRGGRPEWLLHQAFTGQR